MFTLQIYVHLIIAVAEIEVQTRLDEKMLYLLIF